MTLDRDYFNSIRLNPVKGRYYDIYAVDSLLVDIRKQAELTNRRYEEMRGELENAAAENEDCRKKGQVLSDEVLSLREELRKAEQRTVEAEQKNVEAEKKILEAERKTVEAERRAIAAEQELAEMQKRAIAVSTDSEESEENNTESFGSRMREAVEDMVRTMRKIYNSGLQTLDEQWQNFQDNNKMAVPEDLSLRVSRIASALEEINSDLQSEQETEIKKPDAPE